MAKYLIHASPSRMWYLTGYLIPSMVEQGIDRDDISIWEDKKGDGNLESTMKCFAYTERNGSGVWHMQDDVMICRNFKEKTEGLDLGLVTGFCFNTKIDDRINAKNFTTAEHMWHSFPCIRIPNGLARDVGEWYYNTVVPNDLFPELTKLKKNDDSLFYKYVSTYRADELIYQQSPTLVAHVDYLIGGSLVNPDRKAHRGDGLYFLDNDLIDELEEKLRKDGRLSG